MKSVRNFTLALAGALAACGGGSGDGGSSSNQTPTYTISTTVSGLSGTGLVLQNNLGNDLTVTANGSATFSTGLTSGTAYSVTVKTNPSNLSQTCSVANGTGTVASANVSNVTVSCTTNSYSVGVTVTGLSGSGLELQNNGADNLTVNANGAATFATPVISGGTYSVTISTQPTASPGQTCSVTGGSGTVTNAAISGIAVSCRNLVGKFLYIPNRDSANISAFTINSSTGALTAVSGSPFTSGTNTFALAANSAGTYLYATNPVTGSGATLSGFAINTITGALTSVAGSPYPAGASPLVGAPIIHPSQSFLYVNNYLDGAWYGYSIDSSSGALTATPSSPYSVGAGTQGGVFNNSGQYFYAPYGDGMSAAGTLAVYAVDSMTGALSLSSSAALGGNGPVVAKLHPTGNFLYVTNYNSGNLAAFSLDSMSGAATAVSGSPYTLSTYPGGPALHKSGKFLYVVDRGGTPMVPGAGSILGYAINETTGQLTALSGFPLATGGSMAVGPDLYPDGNFLTVPNASSASVGIFGINTTTGALTAAAGSPFATPGTTPGAVVIDSSGSFAYIVDSASATVTAFSINATTGILTVVGTYTTGATPGTPSIVGQQ